MQFGEVRFRVSWEILITGRNFAVSLDSIDQILRSLLQVRASLKDYGSITIIAIHALNKGSTKQNIYDSSTDSPDILSSSSYEQSIESKIQYQNYSKILGNQQE